MLVSEKQILFDRAAITSKSIRISIDINAPSDDAARIYPDQLRVELRPDLLPSCRECLCAAAYLDAARLPGRKYIIYDKGDLAVTLYVAKLLTLTYTMTPDVDGV